MAERVPVDEGAEAFIELLNANGVDCIFLSPGGETVPIQEALAKFKALGKRTPRLIPCLHESVALNAAQGYYLVSGRPQVVMVHADLGTQQVGGALHSAQRGRTGVIFCAGRSPSSLEEPTNYGRRSYVHWSTEQFDQAGIVRGYVKWYYELRTNELIHQVVQRAFRVAATEPCGPVYLVLPPELLGEKIESVLVPDVARYAPPAPPQADEALLEQAARMLIGARNPLLITGYAGRNQPTVAALVELAEALSMRVISYPFRLNFPATHPLYSGSNPHPYLADADVILVVDHDAPYVPTQVKPGPQAKIIHIDIDALKNDMPSWHFPVDLFIRADSAKAVPALVEIVAKQMGAQPARIKERFQRLEGEYKEKRARWLEVALSQAQKKPITTEWLCQAVARAIDEDTIVLDEAMTGSLALEHQIYPSRPGTLFKTGGSSLGWGLGAALGVKLAAPERTVVHLVGDGGFSYGCPQASLWAAATCGAPFLSVVFNNQQYQAIRRAIHRNYGRDSFSDKTGLWAGTEIEPSPDYALAARSAGGYGQRVTGPAELEAAIDAALGEVRRGLPAVLDVSTARVG